MPLIIRTTSILWRRVHGTESIPPFPRIARTNLPPYQTTKPMKMPLPIRGKIRAVGFPMSRSRSSGVMRARVREATLILMPIHCSPNLAISQQTQLLTGLLRFPKPWNLIPPSSPASNETPSLRGPLLYDPSPMRLLPLRTPNFRRGSL